MRVKFGMVKRILLIFSLIGFCALTLAVLAAVLFDPNDYRDQIAAALSDRTGREVKVQGPLHLAYFPWFGVSAGRITIKDVKEEAPFLELDGVRFRVLLEPLLFSREMVLDRIMIVNLRLRLRRDESGNNWEDILARLASPAPVEARPAGKDSPSVLMPVAWSGLSVTNATLSYVDEISGNEFLLDRIRLDAGAGLDFGVNLFFRARSSVNRAEAAVTLTGRVKAGLDKGFFVFNNGLLKARVRGEHLGRDRTADIEAGFDYDSRNQLFKLRSLQLDSAGSMLEARGEGLGVFGPERSFQGAFGLKVPDAADILGQELNPESAELLKDLDLAASFSFAASRLELADADLKTRRFGLKGRAACEFGPKPHLELALSTDLIDLDLLLPEGGSKRVDKDQTLFPEWLLWRPGKQGSGLIDLRAARIKARGGLAEDVRLTVKAGDNGIEGDLSAGSFFGGLLDGVLRVKEGKLSLDLELTKVDSAPLASLFSHPPLVRGIADGSVSLSGEGNTPAALAGSVKGKVMAQIIKGEMRISQLLNSDPDRAQGEKSRAETAPFERLTLGLDIDGPGQAFDPAEYPRTPYSLLVNLNLQGGEAKGRFGPRPPARGRAALDARVLLDLEKMSLLKLDKIWIDAAFDCPPEAVGLPAPQDPSLELNLKLTSSGRADLENKTLGVDKFDFQGMGVNVSGKGAARNFPDDPSYSGELRALKFSPLKLMASLGMKKPKTSDPSAFKSASLEFRFEGDAQRISLNNLSASLDRTNWKGRAEAVPAPGPPKRRIWRFDLTADRLNADNYLPPKSKKKGGDRTAPTPWDISMLKGLCLDGAIEIGRLTMFDLDFERFGMKILADKGDIVLSDIKAGFYSGRLDAAIKARADQTLNVSTEAKVLNFRLAPVVGRLGSAGALSGLSSLEFTTASSGLTSLEHKRTLGGGGRIKVTDGHYVYSSRRKAAQSAYGQSKEKSLKTIDFASAGGTFTIARGVVVNEDFYVESPVIQARGEGMVNLPQETVNYVLNVEIIGLSAFPIEISGPMSAPSVDYGRAEMFTDALGRLGGSVLDIFTLPFHILDYTGGETKP